MVAFLSLGIYLVLLNFLHGLEYLAQKNTGLINGLNKTFVISSDKQVTKFSCLSQCDFNSDCKSVVYGNGFDCVLYNKYFLPTEMVFTSSSIFYTKKCNVDQTGRLLRTLNEIDCVNKGFSIYNIFTNYKLRQHVIQYTDRNFDLIHGLGAIQKNGSIQYFGSEYYKGKMIIFDENWNYKTPEYSITFPAHILTTKSEIYITSNNNIYQMDFNFNLIKQYSDIAYSEYRGICHYKVDDRIYTVNVWDNQIKVFDRNLNLLDTVDLSLYQPYSIVELNGIFYIGTDSSQVLVMENKVITRVINIHIPANIISLMIDEDGYMALLAASSKQILLYHINGSFMGKSLNTLDSPTYLTFDLEGRLIVAYTIGFKIFY